jgi:hypothetical protein
MKYKLYAQYLTSNKININALLNVKLFSDALNNLQKYEPNVFL